MMKEFIIRIIAEVKLTEPVLIIGLPGFGDVGRLVAQKLIDSWEAVLYAELYSPCFPDVVIAEENGICRLPRYEFWACPSSDPNFIVLTGDFLPASDKLTAYYELTAKVLEFAKMRGSKWVVTIGGCRETPEKAGRICISSTSKEITASLEKFGATVYRGKIFGIVGIALGLWGIAGLKGVCILGTSAGIVPDYATASRVYAFLNALLKSKAIGY